MLNNGEISQNKRRKLRQIPPNNDHEDRLSSLPEGIIIEILSRLPFESAITTGTVSRQFLNLWKQITSLKITSDLVHSTYNSKLFNAVKNLSSPKINTFEFQFSDPLVEGYDRCINLIRKMCEKQVKEIKVDFYEHDYFVRVLMPENFLFSTQLEVLVLGFGLDYCDGAINLPKLRKLDICVQDSDVGFFMRLVKSCVVLEELRICGDFIKDDHCIDIRGLNLKSLWVDMVRKMQLTTVTIDAPNLHSFRMSGVNMLKYSFGSNASKALSVEVCTTFKHGVSPKGCQEWEFLRSIRNARSLVMQGDMCPAFYYMNDYVLPVFDCLTNLELVLHFPVFWKALMRFLHLCPNLQSVGLTRKGCSWYGSGWMELDVVPHCLSTKVKSLILRDFHGVKLELELISNILMVANVLETLHVTIHASSSDNLLKSLQLRNQAEFCDELCRLPKSSNICKIKVNGMFLPQ